MRSRVRRSLLAMRRLGAVLTGLLLLAALARTAAAHPHVFVEVAPTIVMAKGRIVGVQVKWQFDAIFSSAIIKDFDTDRDRKFSPPEIAKLQAGAFNNLQGYSYFTHFRLAGELQGPKSVQDFTASIEQDKIVYSFVLRPPTFIDPKRTAFDLLFYDETYFVDLRLVEGQPVPLTGAPDCKAEVDRSPDLPDYGGMFIPELIHVRCS